jgi:thioesterase domain-containing protein
MQPAGPYHLLGHSFGGWIALEIARQLIEAGAVVAPVVLVDTQAPRVHGHAGRDQAMHEYVKLMDLNIAAGLGVSAADLASRDRPSQVLLVFEKMKQARVLPARARLEDFEPVIEMFCRQCGIGYQAQQPFGGLPLLFCAAPAYEDERLDLDAWQRLEPGLRAVHVDGSDHLSILKPPHVARLVEEIGKHWYLG